MNFLDDLKAVAERANLHKENFWLHKFGATFATWSLWKDDKEAKELPVRRALLDQTIWGFGIGGEDTKVDFARLSPCVQIMVR